MSNRFLLAFLFTILWISALQAADFNRLTLGMPFNYWTDATPAFVNVTLDASGEAVEQIFQCEEAATITKLGFRYGVRALTPPTYIISLQDVTLGAGGGIPEGTPLGGASPASATFLPPADTTWDGTWQWITLANSYTCTRGQWLAMVITYSSGIIDGTNYSTFTSTLMSAAYNRNGNQYAISNVGGVRTRATSYSVFGYTDGTNYYGIPLESWTVVNYSSDTVGADEYALKFTFNASWCATFKVSGLRAWVTTPAASKTLLITLYDGTTSLQTFTWDSDITVVVGGGARRIKILFDEATLSTLTCGTAYRVAIAPQETASAYSLHIMDVNSSAELDAFEGGNTWYLNTRVDSGAWTDDATVNYRRPMIELIVDDITEPAGGGTTVVPSVIGY